MNHRLALALAALLLAAPATWAEEAYVIKIKPEWKAGRRTQFTETFTENSRTVLTDGTGKAVEDTTLSIEKSAVVEETIVALKAGTKRPEKILMKFDKLKFKRNGEAVDHGLDGKTVVAELQGDDFALSIEGGGKLNDEANHLLKEELRDEYLDEEYDFDRLYLPAKPVRVGETWSCDIQALAKVIEKQEGFKIDVAKAKGTGKLVKVSKKDGHTFGELEITVDLPVRQFADLDGDEVKPHEGSKSKMLYSYAGCIDGSVDEGVMTITAEETIKYDMQKMKGTTFQLSNKGKSVTERKELANK